ncbi:hypothetical protein [Streptomyces mirabilis]|uniref:hypothetical protein n=1 Tax=Streptomyces mirabilis TaxID=68239 RepID=UPI0036F094F7
MAPNDPTPTADNDRPTTKTTKSRFAEARAWWTEAWDKDGILHQSGVPTGSLSGPWLMPLHLSS